MDKKEIKATLKNIEAAIKKMDDKKKVRLYFFVADSKGSPVGSLAYTYDLAYKLQELGYNVKMLYAEKEFVGVKDWLGEKYANLTHLDTVKDNVDIAPSDFLFIPELFSNVMEKTRELPCKKIAILEDFDFLTDLIPYGASWEGLGIRDCITTSETMKKRLLEIFPNINTHVIRPSISEEFKPSDKRNLVINIVSKDESDINRIVKPFKWKYPIYDFVSFRYLNGRPRAEFANYLRDGSITVWVDEKTCFGYSALEAMASGNLVIGKVPENEPEWMFDEEGNLLDNGLWYYNTRDAHRLLANAIQTLLYDKMPQGLYDNMKETVSQYTDEKQVEEIKDVVENGIFGLRKKELKIMADALKNNLEKETNE